MDLNADSGWCALSGGGGVLLNSRTRPSNTPGAVSAQTGWTVLGRCGVVLGIIGFADFVLVFYPGRFGDPTWEFAAVDAAFSSLPVFTVGLGLLISAALAQGFVTRVRVLAVVCMLLAVAIVALMLLYATNIPLALKLSPPDVLPGIYKSIIRTVLMAVVFGTGFVVAAFTAWRRTRK